MAKKFSIPEDEYIVKKPHEDKSQNGIKLISIDDLLMDESNPEIYGGTLENITALANEIKENGFK